MAAAGSDLFENHYALLRATFTAPAIDPNTSSFLRPNYNLDVSTVTYKTSALTYNSFADAMTPSFVSSWRNELRHAQPATTSVLYWIKRRIETSSQASCGVRNASPAVAAFPERLVINY
ncbi:MAG: hypothetical protein ACRETW_08625 [Stenotrophobium sp.]